MTYYAVKAFWRRVDSVFDNVLTFYICFIMRHANGILMVRFYSAFTKLNVWTFCVIARC